MGHRAHTTFRTDLLTAVAVCEGAPTFEVVVAGVGLGRDVNKYISERADRKSVV